MVKLRIEELKEFGVSESIIGRLKQLDFNSLTQAQEEAVRNGLFDKKSLLISAPTNTGKTFIGELAALNVSKQADPKRSFFLVPLKALAEQMFADFHKRYEKWGLKVAISTSDHYEFDNDLLDFDVTISTYEKLNSLMVKKPEIILNTGLIVVDEIQHLGDGNRGISLEILLTKLRYFAKNIQIIGLSATVQNAEQLARWLDCSLIQVDERDVELREGILYEGSEPLQFRNLTLNNGDFLYKEFNSKKTGIERNLNLSDVRTIITQSAKEQFLVFVNTQAKAEETAQQIARQMPVLPEMDALIGGLDDLVESTPVTAKIKKVLTKGVAFHHAGLLSDERQVIESSFRGGLIRIICATPTLATGVNTPAKNVIILSYRYHDNTRMTVSAYKNTSGRAGRLRKTDEFGRSILIVSSERELEFLWDNYVNAKPERVNSQISIAGGLDCSIMGLISSKAFPTRKELASFLGLTFYGYLTKVLKPTTFEAEILNTVNQEVDKLKVMEFITENGKIEATLLGQRCAEELLSPSTVSMLYQSLTKKEETIQKAGDYGSLVPGIIHLCCSTDDADMLYPPRSETESQELIATWTINSELYFIGPFEKNAFLRSLRTTRMLLRWIEGVPFNDLNQYAPAGVIKRIAENIQWVSKGLAHLAEKPLFNFKPEFVDFLFELSERIYFGVPSEALAIMKLRIQGIHRRRALNLAKAGYATIDSLIEADIEDLKNVDDISDVLAHRIKEEVEEYLDNESQKRKSEQLRLAEKMCKNKEIILGLYSNQGDDFSKHLVRIFREELKMDAVYVGDKSPHEPDILIKIPAGNIVIEAKRKKKGSVNALEAEEILGKGAKYKPIANVTIGYPDFADVAKQNVNSKITLISAAMLGQLLVEFWGGKIKDAEVLSLLCFGKYIYDIKSNFLRHD